ncbi:hypothetical protein F751_0020 [Auxenochlorella protothecoides]|uniref:Uncharacterized protein n=1 Tax=Auxenochlorella protothecoides TaxID=3075 RepID=A0A087S9V8_AUXPR|nr:hypothetical protein F751_0020 [Auxenochlorella protothecoides]KFM22512.1 hypothetical protein F751_0020 [Auxenochlorella protothecoides]
MPDAHLATSRGSRRKCRHWGEGGVRATGRVRRPLPGDARAGWRHPSAARPGVHPPAH